MRLVSISKVAVLFATVLIVIAIGMTGTVYWRELLLGLGGLIALGFVFLGGGDSNGREVKSAAVEAYLLGSSYEGTGGSVSASGNVGGDAGGDGDD